ncbi:Cobalamin biosynthesis protein CobN [Pseudomonas syringae pv. actinidiae]|uniref:Cobalamin biosynthesis protein CobN n=1 Tax=Pseudomonas syringae pv. actinidiae TaxID=103796 RepID=A0A2V0QA29_PSESF|nr:Cobalamin biosynthesis protein CobN [Pseudomonas syringae pv. actinidiae]
MGPSHSAVAMGSSISRVSLHATVHPHVFSPLIYLGFFMRCFPAVSCGTLSAVYSVVTH